MEMFWWNANGGWKTERICWRFDRSLFLFSLISNMHKDTKAETKGKALLLFGYLTKKPQSYVLGAVFICDVH